MAREESPKSKLIKLLQRVSRGSSARIGLVPMAEQKVPALALVVALEQADAQSVKTATQAGADAVAVRSGQAIARWNELVAAAGDKPLGLQIHGAASADDLKQYVERADFVVASAQEAPATLLELEGAAKILAVDEEYPPQLIRTLGELPVDAVVAQSKAADNQPLTVRDLLHFRQVVDLVRRPVLGIADQRFSPELLKLFRQMGIEGVLLEVSTKDIGETVEAYRKAIDGLGRPIGRAREFGREAAVPQLRPGIAGPMVEPEEEPDEDD